MENIINNGTCKIIVSGDSISKGVVYKEDNGRYEITKDNYVSLIQKHLMGIIHNTARFGNTIFKGFCRLKQDVQKENPDIVLLEFGGNDCDFDWVKVAENPEGEHLPKTDYNMFGKMLKEAVDFLNLQKIIPILMTLPPLDPDKYLKLISKNNPVAEKNILKWLGSVAKIYWWHEKYNSLIIKVAQETQTKLIDVRGAFLNYPDFTKFLCVDGIHPNAEGQRIIAEKILEFFKSAYGFLLKNGEEYENKFQLAKTLRDI